MELADLHADTISEHRRWLVATGEEWRVKRWNQQLAAQPETAISEAVLRGLLETHGCEVTPAEHASEGGPDFLCRVTDGSFYVECACIIEERAANTSNLAPHASGEPGFYSHMTSAFLHTCRKKESQCGMVNDQPCLLAICTLHFQASALCFGKRGAEMVLTSDTSLTATFDPARGEAIGEFTETTDLRASAFIRHSNQDDAELESARRTIAGVLLCGFGSMTPVVNGVLHVDALRPFNRRLLPGLPFCRLKYGYQEGHFEVEWI